MTQPEVQVRGLNEFRRELRRIDGSRFANTTRRVHRKVADLVAGKARAAAGSRLGRAIKPSATNNSAKVVMVDNPPDALAKLWGTNRRTGWYAAPRFAASTGRQHPTWVGNQWDPGENGGKPYIVGDAINASVDEIERIYLVDLIDEVTRDAFPN